MNNFQYLLNLINFYHYKMIFKNVCYKYNVTIRNYLECYYYYYIVHYRRTDYSVTKLQPIFLNISVYYYMYYKLNVFKKLDLGKKYINSQDLFT